MLLHTDGFLNSHIALILMAIKKITYGALKDFHENEIWDVPVENPIQLIHNPNMAFLAAMPLMMTKKNLDAGIKEPEVPMTIIPTVKDVQFSGDFDFALLAQSPTIHQQVQILLWIFLENTSKKFKIFKRASSLRKCTFKDFFPICIKSHTVSSSTKNSSKLPSPIRGRFVSVLTRLSQTASVMPETEESLICLPSSM